MVGCNILYKSYPLQIIKFSLFFAFLLFTPIVFYSKLKIMRNLTRRKKVMLNVIYIGDTSADPCEEPRRQYLDACLRKCSAFQLSNTEQEFIKDFILLVSYYIEFVLLEEEHNPQVFARMLAYSNVSNNSSPLLVLIEDATENESLSKQQKEVLNKYLERIKTQYFPENILLALQVIQFSAVLDPECSKAVSNLINLSILKCNMPEIENDTLSLLCSKAMEEQYLSFVYPEFSLHYEKLLKENSGRVEDGKLLEYVYKKVDQLPKTMRDKILEYDFEIRLSNQLLTKQKNFKKLGSTHLCGNQIRVWLVNDKIIVDLSLYHEMGHVIDYAYGNASLYSRKNSAWKILYEADRLSFYEGKKKLNPDFTELYEYAIQNETEYFAAAFSEYIQEPEELKNIVPDTFYFLESLFSQ